jgi:hypothetical protein
MLVLGVQFMRAVIFAMMLVFGTQTIAQSSSANTQEFHELFATTDDGRRVLLNTRMRVWVLVDEQNEPIIHKQLPHITQENL